MKVGNLTVDVVWDGRFSCPPDQLYPDVPRARWRPFAPLLEEDGSTLVNELGGFLVRGEGSVVLVDLGFGPVQVGEGWITGRFLDSLAALGVAAASVTDIVFSHLHFDHIGWASVNGVPTFPNARLHCDARDWAHFTSGYEPAPVELGLPAEMLPEHKLRPVVDRIEMWEECGEILPGIEAVDAAGHSPGHCMVAIADQGEKALLIADVAHHQAELLAPDWPGMGDQEPDRARACRDALVRELVETGTPFVASHFGGFDWGRMRRAPDGSYAWERIADGLTVHA